jgi:3-methyl-2-oxobutanoate hydroxymethyltransferase
MKITLPTLKNMKQKQEKIACLTAYDASFARYLDQHGIDVVLVGDTLGEVIQGHESTIPVTLADMCYHVRMVARGIQNAFIIGDMPFMSYCNPEQALQTATQLMQAGAQMVKLEGGVWLKETVFRLTQCGIPVCAHLGLTPQSVHKLGGYRKQGKTPETAERLIADAKALEEAGADLMVFECIPADLATTLTQQLSIPTIGIGAGPGTDAQILVLYDILGIASRPPSSFVAEFLKVCPEPAVEARIQGYIHAVKNRQYPIH